MSNCFPGDQLTLDHCPTTKMSFISYQASRHQHLLEHSIACSFYLLVLVRSLWTHLSSPLDDISQRRQHHLCYFCMDMSSTHFQLGYHILYPVVGFFLGHDNKAHICLWVLYFKVKSSKFLTYTLRNFPAKLNAGRDSTKEEKKKNKKKLDRAVGLSLQSSIQNKSLLSSPIDSRVRRILPGFAVTGLLHHVHCFYTFFFLI